MGFCWWPAAREGGILVGAWGNKAKRRKAAESQCPWRCSSARPRGVLKVFWELVTEGGGGADVACGLILGRWELGPASAARVGENDRWSGAVKPIPVLLLGTTCCLEQARDGWKVVPDGDDGVEMAWWRRCESSVGLGGIEGESRETGVQKRFTYHGLSTREECMQMKPTAGPKRKYNSPRHPGMPPFEVIEIAAAAASCAASGGLGLGSGSWTSSCATDARLGEVRHGEAPSTGVDRAK